MNLGELKQNILTDTHRYDQENELPRFIRQAEGLIRRELTAFLLRTTIGAAQQITDGIYSLPQYFLRERSFNIQGATGNGLTKVNPENIRRLDSTLEPVEYAILGAGMVEFRGWLREGMTLDLLYYGAPEPLVLESDTNALLNDHESLYQSAATFFLYKRTQDLTLAQSELELFQSIMRTLNRQVAKELGGVAVQAPYQFSYGSSY